MVYRRVYCCYCASFGFDASILCALRSVPTMKTYGMVSLHSFTAWHIHSRHHKHLGKILHDHSFLTIEKSQHQLNGSCELGIIYIFQQPDDFFSHFTMSEWNSHKLSLVHGYLKGQSQDSNQVCWVPETELFTIHYWSWWRWWWWPWWLSWWWW